MSLDAPEPRRRARSSLGLLLSALVVAAGCNRSDGEGGPEPGSPAPAAAGAPRTVREGLPDGISSRLVGRWTLDPEGLRRLASQEEAEHGAAGARAVAVLGVMDPTYVFGADGSMSFSMRSAAGEGPPSTVTGRWELVAVDGETVTLEVVDDDGPATMTALFRGEGAIELRSRGEAQGMPLTRR